MDAQDERQVLFLLSFPAKRTERILGDANGITDEETRIKYLEEKSQEITRVLVVTEERLQKI